MSTCSNDKALCAYLTGDGKNHIGAAVDARIPLHERAEALARLQAELDTRFNIQTVASAQVKVHIGDQGAEALARLQADLNRNTSASIQFTTPIGNQFSANAGAGVDANRYFQREHITGGVGYQPTPNLQFGVQGRRDFMPGFATNSVMGGMTYRF